MIEGLTLPLLITAALADSINPCVFGVLIFLIAFMLKVFKTPTRMVIGGLLYTFVVYVAYFFIGLGIIQLTVSLGVTVIIYWIAASIAILAGLLEIKDFFWYGKGMSLQIFPSASKRLKLLTNSIEKINKKHPLASYGMAALLGFFVVLVELPCTGAPYLAILALLAKGAYGEAIPLLLLYNLIFIIPLFVIIGLAYFGLSHKKLEQWRLKNRKWMRLGIGIFLIALGLYMISTII